jgi:hypothetical protein
MTQLRNSMFYDILFPKDEEEMQGQGELFVQKMLRHHITQEARI